MAFPSLYFGSRGDDIKSPRPLFAIVALLVIFGARNLRGDVLPADDISPNRTTIKPVRPKAAVPRAPAKPAPQQNPRVVEPPAKSRPSFDPDDALRILENEARFGRPMEGGTPTMEPGLPLNITTRPPPAPPPVAKPQEPSESGSAQLLPDSKSFPTYEEKAALQRAEDGRDPKSMNADDDTSGDGDMTQDGEKGVGDQAAKVGRSIVDFGKAGVETVKEPFQKAKEMWNTPKTFEDGVVDSLSSEDPDGTNGNAQRQQKPEAPTPYEKLKDAGGAVVNNSKDLVRGVIDKATGSKRAGAGTEDGAPGGGEDASVPENETDAGSHRGDPPSSQGTQGQ